MLTELFTETLVQVFRNLDPKDISSVNRTCRGLYEITTSNSYLWQVKFIERFGLLKLPGHLSWREFYLSYRVVWSFGTNELGRLGQGATPCVKYDYNKTKVDGRFVSAALSNYSTAFLEPNGSVWVSGLYSKTNVPVPLGIQAKQVDFDNQGKLLYIDQQDNLWSDGVKIQERVNSFSFHGKEGLLSIDLDGSLYRFDQTRPNKIETGRRFRRVVREILQDTSGRLWNSDGPILLDGQHLPVRDFDVSNPRVTVIDEKGSLWISDLPPAVFLIKMPGRQYKACSTDSYNSLLIDAEDQVWSWGLRPEDHPFGNIMKGVELIPGIRASFVRTRYDYSVIIGQTC